MTEVPLEQASTGILHAEGVSLNESSPNPNRAHHFPRAHSFVKVTPPRTAKMEEPAA